MMKDLQYRIKNIPRPGYCPNFMCFNWSLGEVIPEDLYANMTVLQILKKCHVVPF